jgi:hypothetical protein
MAQTPDDAFNRGNELYRANKYKEAVKEYENILKQGYVSAEVYFNLGNSYYRMDKLAQAILAYERAASLNPQDQDIEHNLKLLNLKTIDRIEPVPELFILQWMRALGTLVSTKSVRTLFLISWIFLFCSLTSLFFVTHPSIIRIGRIILLPSFIFVCVWGFMMGIQSIQGASHNEAIITTQTVTAKSSPDAKSIDAFVIHEGLKVRLTDSVAGWVKITLADGKVGWINAEECEKI